MDETPAPADTIRIAYAAMEREWRELSLAKEAQTLEAWAAAFNRMRQAQEALIRGGEWISGPADLMTVLRVNDLELMHSKAVAWLMTPTAQHGLGDTVLATILDHGWPDRPKLPTTTASVRLEVPQITTRADVIVDLRDGVLVIENKVWSPESLDQCESQFVEWIGTVSDVRFLLLSPLGLPPASTRSRRASEAWRSISYGALATLLRSALEGAPRTDHPGRAAAWQYLATLESMFTPAPMQITVGGGHTDEY